METYFPWNDCPKRLFRAYRVQNSILAFSPDEVKEVRIACNIGFCEVISVIEQIKQRKAGDPESKLVSANGQG